MFATRRERDMVEWSNAECADGEESDAPLTDDEDPVGDKQGSGHPVTFTGALTFHSRSHSPANGGGHNKKHQYDLRSRKNSQAMQMPLIQQGPRQGEVYQPFSFTDMNCILDKMPPPSEGGGPWMSKFCQYTLGYKLAMGDWRALIGKQLGMWDIRQLETAAGTTHLPDASPFSPHATNIGKALRDTFPIPPSAMHALTFHIKDGEDVSSFLIRCKGEWTDTAGSHPGSSIIQTTLFRNAVMTGMPISVKEVMEGNPDIPSCSTEQWEKHLTHHLKRYRSKLEEDKQNLDNTQAQLLKLQLDKAR